MFRMPELETLLRTFLSYGISIMTIAVFIAILLWLSMKLTRVDGAFMGMLLIGLVVALFSLIPYVGWILSAVVMCIMLCKLTNASFWPDAVLLVVVAYLILVIATYFLADRVTSVQNDLIRRMMGQI